MKATLEDGRDVELTTVANIRQNPGRYELLYPALNTWRSAEYVEESDDKSFSQLLVVCRLRDPLQEKIKEAVAGATNADEALAAVEKVKAEESEELRKLQEVKAIENALIDKLLPEVLPKDS